jgi:hypothetical protein
VLAKDQGFKSRVCLFGILNSLRNIQIKKEEKHQYWLSDMFITSFMSPLEANKIVSITLAFSYNFLQLSELEFPNTSYQLVSK